MADPHAETPHMQQVNVRLPDHLHAQVQREAEHDGVTQAVVMRQALRFYFQAQESMRAVLRQSLSDDETVAMLADGPTAFLVWFYNEYFGPSGRFTERVRAASTHAH